MIKPCTCGSLAKWARDCDMAILQRNGEFLLGDGSIDDPRLTIHFCPFCGEHGWPDRGNRPCECGVMEYLVRDFPDLMEFDSKMNEYHILYASRKGSIQVYYCIACGGNPPQSLRPTFFEDASDSDYDEAWARIANLKDEEAFLREFGAPAYLFDLPPPSAKDIEIYGRKPIKKQWTFVPPGSRVSYCLQLMADGSYRTSLSPAHKKPRKPHD